MKLKNVLSAILVQPRGASKRWQDDSTRSTTTPRMAPWSVTMRCPLIASARANGVEPVAYLTACLRSHEALAKRPEHYLPWAYRERERCNDSDISRAPPCHAPRGDPKLE